MLLSVKIKMMRISIDSYWSTALYMMLLTMCLEECALLKRHDLKETSNEKYLWFIYLFIKKIFKPFFIFNGNGLFSCFSWHICDKTDKVIESLQMSHSPSLCETAPVTKAGGGTLWLCASYFSFGDLFQVPGHNENLEFVWFHVNLEIKRFWMWITYWPPWLAKHVWLPFIYLFIFKDLLLCATEWRKTYRFGLALR